MLNRISFAILLLIGSTVAASQPGPSWSLSYSDSEGLHKLIYGEPETEGEVYLRCRAGSGWVFLILDYEPKLGNPPLKLSAGAETISPSFRVEYDGVVSDAFYVDVAIPANHRVLDALAAGSSLRFEGRSYPVRTDVERNSIRNFQTVCDGDG